VREGLGGALEGEPRSWWGSRGAAAGAPHFTGSLPLWGQLCSGYASDVHRPGRDLVRSGLSCCASRLGSIARFAGKPALQVVGAGEIEQILR
jgi:hypothetical protein